MSHNVQATPSWPPIAIPGRPGWWRHYSPNGEQIDLSTNEEQQWTSEQ